MEGSWSGEECSSGRICGIRWRALPVSRKVCSLQSRTLTTAQDRLCASARSPFFTFLSGGSRCWRSSFSSPSSFISCISIIWILSHRMWARNDSVLATFVISVQPIQVGGKTVFGWDHWPKAILGTMFSAKIRVSLHLAGFGDNRPSEEVLRVYENKTEWIFITFLFHPFAESVAPGRSSAARRAVQSQGHCSEALTVFRGAHKLTHCLDSRKQQFITPE